MTDPAAPLSADKSALTQARKPRGFPDRRADQLVAESALTEAVTGVYKAWGFEPLETGAFEYVEALGKFLPDTDRPNEGVFALLDDDAQWIALRYDLTAPLARFAAEHWNEIPKPFRRYAVGPVWRNEKPGPGRFREFLQCDADTVGAGGAAADAEMIAMAAEAMTAAGLGPGEFAIKVNTRRLLNGVLDARIDGYHEFRGDRERIRFKTGPPIVPAFSTYSQNFSAAPVLANTQAAEQFIEVLLDGNNVGTLHISPTHVTSPQFDLGLGTVVCGLAEPQPLKLLTRLVQMAEYARCVDCLLDIKNAATAPVLDEYSFAGEEIKYKVYATTVEEQPFECIQWPKRIRISHKTDDGIGGWKVVELGSGTPNPTGAVQGALYQVGRQGFVPGDYDLTVYCVYYRKLNETKGRIEVDDM